MITGTSPYGDGMTIDSTAPFVITHHGDAGEWHDSPILWSLIGFTVAVTTKDGSIYEGVVLSVNTDGSFTLVNESDLNAWGTITIRLLHIANIHYHIANIHYN